MTSRAPARAAILFDIDGTLVDTTYHHALAWSRAFAAAGVPAPLWRVHRAVGMGGDKLVTHVVGEEVEADQGDALREAWGEQFAAISGEVRPLPGAADLVHRLAQAGWTVALASSGQKRFATESVDLLGIADDIAVMTTSEDAEESKPEPDLVTSTLGRLDVDRAVFVGDTPYDVDAAGRAGLRCVAVLTGGFGRTELEEAGAAAGGRGPHRAGRPGLGGTARRAGRPGLTCRPGTQGQGAGRPRTARLLWRKHRAELRLHPDDRAERPQGPGRYAAAPRRSASTSR